MSTLVLAFAVRAVATAGVVLAATVAIERAGPRLGGIVAGLPIVLGPGLAFLAFTLDGAALGEAATAAVWSLSATVAFMLAYGLAARHLRPALALLAAVAAWAAAAGSLHTMTQSMTVLGASPLPAFIAYLLATGLLHGVLVAPTDVPVAGLPPRRGMLVLRAGLAGLLVGAVTVTAPWFGPAAAGLLLGFPIGMSTIAFSLHQRLGAAPTIAALRGTALGLLSLGSFCLVTALLSGPLAPFPALGVALVAALAVSAALALGFRPRGARVLSHAATAAPAAGRDRAGE